VIEPNELRPTDPPAEIPAESEDAPAEVTVKKTIAKKTTGARKSVKKIAAKKAVTKKATVKKVAGTAAAQSAQQAKYPRHSVERALRIPTAIYQQNGGKPATPREAAVFTGGTTVTGAFNVEISSSKKYGFLSSEAGKLVLTDRARRAIAPQSESDRVNALREAVLAAPDISEVYNFYRGGNLPDKQFLVNALTDRFYISTDRVTDFLDIFNESIRSAELVDASGERPTLIDAGRDEAHRPASGKVASKAAVASGTTCFVMQPFAAPLGTYYATIYKPAIEQAGLEAVRADTEIFGTGKIIDQIWRGINSASVLIAELTTKNPNVFYELGLAHALRKPVILISSNQDDVPFDLRHIRVILYDQTDPFWGQKLTDNIADKIKSAINDPEEAIFPIDKLSA